MSIASILPPPSHSANQIYDSNRRLHPFFEEIVEVAQFRELVLLWTARNIKLRYKRSVLGIVWTLLEPLMLMTILTIVFSTVFRFQLANYPVYLLSGLLLFDFISRSSLQIIDETVASESLASRVHVPRTVFALATILAYLVSWAIALIPLLLIVLVLDHPMSAALVSVPLGMALAGLFALGLGLLVGALGISFHDVKLTYQVLLTAWLYATPIIYPLEIVPERFRSIFPLNPLLHLCAVVRDPVYLGRSASLASWGAAIVSSLTMLTIGWWVFTSRRDKFDYSG